jgi:hypothetical protein
MFQSLLSCHPGGIHSHTILNIPEYISDEAKSFLKEVSVLHSSSHRPESLKTNPSCVCQFYYRGMCINILKDRELSK